MSAGQFVLTMTNSLVFLLLLLSISNCTFVTFLRDLLFLPDVMFFHVLFYFILLCINSVYFSLIISFLLSNYCPIAY